MKFIMRIILKTNFHKFSKLGALAMFLFGMIAGRISANLIINTNSSQLNALVFSLLLGSWMLLFIRKVLNKA